MIVCRFDTCTHHRSCQKILNLQQRSRIYFPRQQSRISLSPAIKDLFSSAIQQISKSISLPTEYHFPAWSLEYLFSPQNPPFAKFIPQRSHLLLPVFLQLSSPAEAKSILQHQPRIRLPGIRQGFTFLDKNIHKTSHTSL